MSTVSDGCIRGSASLIAIAGCNLEKRDGDDDFFVYTINITSSPNCPIVC